MRVHCYISMLGALIFIITADDFSVFNAAQEKKSAQVKSQVMCGVARGTSKNIRFYQPRERAFLFI